MDTPLTIARELCRNYTGPYFDFRNTKVLEDAIAKTIQKERDATLAAENATKEVVMQVALLLQNIDKDGKQRSALYDVMPEKLRKY